VDAVLALISNPSSLGLAYDGVGVFVLGIPALLSTKRDLRSYGATGYGGFSQNSIRQLVLSRLDTGTGSLFLVAGFLLQFFGSFGLQLDVAWGATITALLPVLLILYWSWLRRRTCEKWVSEIVTSMKSAGNEKGAR